MIVFEFSKELMDKFKSAVISGLEDNLELKEAYHRTDSDSLSRVNVRKWFKDAHDNHSTNTAELAKQIMLEHEGKTNDQLAIILLKEVVRRITYKRDEERFGKLEYWQKPDETLANGEGDCEDGAVLLMSLMLHCGFPREQIRMWCGSVQGGGHAYTCYVAEHDGVEYVLDWCYWLSYRPIGVNRVPVRSNNKYLNRWFGVTYKKSYAGDAR